MRSWAPAGVAGHRAARAQTARNHGVRLPGTEIAPTPPRPRPLARRRSRPAGPTIGSAATKRVWLALSELESGVVVRRSTVTRCGSILLPPGSSAAGRSARRVRYTPGLRRVLHNERPQDGGEGKGEGAGGEAGR